MKNQIPLNQFTDLTREDFNELVQRSNNDIQAKLERSQGKVVLFGAGRLGEHIIKCARNAGLSVSAFVDNNPDKWGNLFDGIEIISPAESISRFADNNLFVITVFTSAPVWVQLRNLGVEPVSFARLSWLYPEQFPPFGWVQLPDTIHQNAKKLCETLSVWTDEESRIEFLELIRWCSTLEPEILRPHSPTENTYFADDLFKLEGNEVFVDCGAYDGDSIRAFMARVHGQFHKIIGFEPDSTNRDRFEEFRLSLPFGCAEKITLLPYAAGEKNELLVFNNTGTFASSLGSGQNEVQCIPLDDLINAKPTFIKMDIEGAEPLALRGAANLIKTHRPILAICLYHAIEHLWEIPLWLNQLVPNYDLFLRRYSDECWEIVCYAVPRERSIARVSAGGQNQPL